MGLKKKGMFFLWIERPLHQTVLETKRIKENENGASKKAQNKKLDEYKVFSTVITSLKGPEIFIKLDNKVVPVMLDTRLEINLCDVSLARNIKLSPNKFMFKAANNIPIKGKGIWESVKLKWVNETPIADLIGCGNLNRLCIFGQDAMRKHWICLYRKEERKDWVCTSLKQKVMDL